MSMIKIEHLSKTFDMRRSQVHAVHDVSLDIEEGEIFGVIGLSGAGKSTLVRCINYLEKPTAGRITIGGREMGTLSGKKLRLARREIGMIFQEFNLLMQRSVLDNVCLPLEIAGVKKKEAREQAIEYLRTVELEDKASAYPAQLSGGQKQRVAIARVLASKPKIILCDEATSALDPQTTQNILSLLKRINSDYGITMVIITHEMRVIEQICTRVAVLDRGSVAELGTVSEVFSAPKTKAAQRLLRAKVYEELEDEISKEGDENVIIDQSLDKMTTGKCGTFHWYGDDDL